MKKTLHPPYYAHATVRCACGKQFVVGATKETLDIEICSQCHPFYTGREKVMDVAGRVERYKKIVAQARSKAKTLKTQTTKGKGESKGNAQDDNNG